MSAAVVFEVVHGVPGKGEQTAEPTRLQRV